MSQKNSKSSNRSSKRSSKRSTINNNTKRNLDSLMTDLRKTLEITKHYMDKHFEKIYTSANKAEFEYEGRIKDLPDYSTLEEIRKHLQQINESLAAKTTLKNYFNI